MLLVSALAMVAGVAVETACSSPSAQRADSVTETISDPAGGVLLIGMLTGTVDFGGGPLTATSPSNFFFARFAP
jgi:hypothetical protein